MTGQDVGGGGGGNATHDFKVLEHIISGNISWQFFKTGEMITIFILTLFGLTL